MGFDLDKLNVAPKELAFCMRWREGKVIEQIGGEPVHPFSPAALVTQSRCQGLRQNRISNTRHNPRRGALHILDDVQALRHTTNRRSITRSQTYRPDTA